jgi:SAM-dependent methyltransferase
MRSALPYGEHLAHVHVAGFSGGSGAMARELLRCLRSAGVRGGLVVDLGCGGGEWVERLLRAGFDVIGVDQSPAMVRRARQRAPKARIVCSSWDRFRLPTCRAITALGEVFNYVGMRRPSTPALRRFFRKAYRALSTGGVMLFDLAGPGRGEGGAPSRAFFEGDGWALLLSKDEDPGRHELVRKMTIFRRVGTRYARSEEVHRLRLFEPEEIVAALTDAGFAVTTSRGLGRHGLGAGLTAFMARKT